MYFQEKDADHIYSVDRKDPSRIVYYPTGRPGAGTEGYNSPVTALGSKASLPPGWGPPPVRTEEIRNPRQVPVILTTMTEPDIEKVIVYHKGNFIFTYDLNFRLKQEKRLELAPVAFPAFSRYVHHPSIEASFA